MSRNVFLVFEVKIHLTMGKFVTTAQNHNRLFLLVEQKNMGIHLDRFQGPL